jgi:predicted dinucleotide-binding enzyme
MRIAVLGTGGVGQALAGRLDELGHDVTLGTRDPRATLARAGGDHNGGPAPAVWLADHPGVSLLPHAEAVTGAEVVVNALQGAATLETLGAIGAEALAGTVLLDLSNPLDFSAGFPPTLFVAGDDSLGEQVQRLLPRTQVVKGLNTVASTLMVRPDLLADGEHTVFVSGDSGPAKATVVALLTEMGHTDVVDLGDLSTGRGAEMLLPLWLRLWGALGTPVFGIKVVR